MKDHVKDHVELIHVLAICFCVLVFCVAWVLVTMIRNSHRHKWIKIGDRIRGRWDGEDQWRQPVECEKCGKLSWFRVA